MFIWPIIAATFLYQMNKQGITNGINRWSDVTDDIAKFVHFDRLVRCPTSCHVVLQSAHKSLCKAAFSDPPPPTQFSQKRWDFQTSRCLYLHCDIVCVENESNVYECDMKYQVKYDVERPVVNSVSTMFM